MSCAVARTKDGTGWREWLDWAIAAPRRIIAIALFIVIGAAVFGIPVTKSLSAGGFQDPSSESAEGAALLPTSFTRAIWMLITVRSVRCQRIERRRVRVSESGRGRHELRADG
jgi:hypothetical protein